MDIKYYVLCTDISDKDRSDKPEIYMGIVLPKAAGMQEISLL